MLDQHNYNEFMSKIFKLTGIDLSSYKEKQMKRRLDSLIEKKSLNTYDEYINLIKTSPTDLEEFLDRMTINVSEFFRNGERWEVLDQKILPLITAGTDKIKVWSAACSTGQEPYSLAMLFESQGLKYEILATDLDEKVLNKARQGKFNIKEKEGIPEKHHKYLNINGETFTVDPKLKRYIKFQKHNLLENSYPTDFDLILCRNVMIYFKESTKKEVYKRFNQSLKDNGILFVGSTEQIFFASNLSFKSLDTFFYKKVNS
ncbi:protein-glutamate O-methyltransferase CheR [Proteinivorax hydrogeniformans]|uniref:protein-glutamate O-methyltransferase n=1 Tax=Proteinivorax hydrogeniformans TaxID=1826727 RepID=A0AAU8HWX2_9FIRM